MTDTDCKEDDVLKRMLKTPPKKHEADKKVKGEADPKAVPAKG